MKNIKYLIFSVSVLIMMSSCQNDRIDTFIDTEVKTAIVGTLTLDRTSAAPSTQISFTFDLPQSFSTGATVEVRAKTFNLAQTIAYVTLPAGSSSGSGTIEMPGDNEDSTDFFGIDGYATVELTGVALDEGTDDPFVLTSEPITIKSLNYHPTYMSSPNLVPGSLQILFDWAGPYAGSSAPGNDLDMYVFDSNFDQFETAESGDRYEGDFFNATHPDGDYFVAIGFYSVEGSDIPYNLTFTHPDGTVDFYEGVFTDTGNLSFEYPIINITKTTDGNGDAVYTTSLPN